MPCPVLVSKFWTVSPCPKFSRSPDTESDTWICVGFNTLYPSPSNIGVLIPGSKSRIESLYPEFYLYASPSKITYNKKQLSDPLQIKDMLHMLSSSYLKNQTYPVHPPHTIGLGGYDAHGLLNLTYPSAL